MYILSISRHAPVPIGTILPVWVVSDCAISFKVHWRHSMLLRTFVASFGAPFTLIFTQFPSNRTFVFIGPTFL